MSYRRRRSWRGHVGSGARADNNALVVNVVQDRRCLRMDIEAMESREGQVGKATREMGRLPEAV